MENEAEMKELEELTLEELWELFPIELVPFRREWTGYAGKEIDTLRTLLSDVSPTITHIGSTAIPGIMAKPIIDLLVEIPGDTPLTDIRRQMETAGYICMSISDSRMSFNKGYTPAGYAERVFHIHVHPAGDNDEILFRDYLLAHPDTAREYEVLKLSLLPSYRNNRDGYTEAKSDFIHRIVSLAKGLK